MESTTMITLGYQPIQITQKITREEEAIYWECSLSQQRGKAWPSLPSDVTIPLFLWDLKSRKINISSRLEGVLRNNLTANFSHIRGKIRDTVAELVYNSWGHFYIDYPGNPEDVRIFRQWLTDVDPNMGIFADKIANTAVDLLLDTRNANWFKCPDEISNCGYIHSYSDIHDSLSSGNTYPEYLVNDGYISIANIVYHTLERTENGTFSREYTYDSNLVTFSNLPAHQCYCCEEYWENEALSEVDWLVDAANTVTGRTHICYGCTGEVLLLRCENCNNLFDTDYGTYNFDPEYDSYNNAYCWRCFREENGRLRLNPYSFKPAPIFHSIDSNEAPFMGMELEVARSSNISTFQVNKWIENLDPNLFYVKADSSVSYGMEVVTHPFTYLWAKDNFPYDEFEQLIKINGIVPDDPSAGTHIHVGKDAFSVTHMWKFILFFVENKLFFGQLGERGHTHHYGSFEDSHRIRENLLTIVKAKGDPSIISTSRGAININPPNTIELRFMAGNVKPNHIKKNQQLVQAVYDFTKNVSSGDAMKGALKDPGYFLGFVEDTEYTELKNYIQMMYPKPKKLERTS